MRRSLVELRFGCMDFVNRKFTVASASATVTECTPGFATAAVRVVFTVETGQEVPLPVSVVGEELFETAEIVPVE